MRKIFVLILIVCLGCNHYKKGQEYFNAENYRESRNELKKVTKDDENYHQAQLLIDQADSIILAINRERYLRDSIAEAKEKIRRDSIALAEKIQKEKDKIARLKRELNDIRSFNDSEYRGEINSLIIEVALFSTWGKMANEAKNHSNSTIKNLGINMESSLKNLQWREFPKIRAEYARILKSELWAKDIEVRVSGKRYTTLQFTGGIFAANVNKQEFQTTLSETFHDLRFKRTQYKWYEYDDKYTYYTLKSDSDGKIKIY